MLKGLTEIPQCFSTMGTKATQKIILTDTMTEQRKGFSNINCSAISGHANFSCKPLQ